MKLQRADWEQEHNAYHKLLEENRKLYNQVQDLKGDIQIQFSNLIY